MQKAIENSKEYQQEYGFWYYRMQRIINGMVYGYGVCVTEKEMQHHRQFVAWRLRDARRSLRRYIDDLELERVA